MSGYDGADLVEALSIIHIVAPSLFNKQLKRLRIWFVVFFSAE